MNKQQLKQIIKEELKAVLKEFKSTTVFDLEVVMEVMGIRFKEQGDGGLVAVVRKVAEEAAEDARDESGAEAEELMRIAKLSRKCASLMSEAIVLLASATQERPALEESALNEEDAYDIDPSELSAPVDRSPLHKAAQEFDSAVTMLLPLLDASPKLKAALASISHDVRLAASGAKMVEGTLQMTDSGQRIYDEVAPALKDVVKAVFASHGVDDISIEAVADALKDVAKMVEKY